MLSFFLQGKTVRLRRNHVEWEREREKRERERERPASHANDELMMRFPCISLPLLISYFFSRFTRVHCKVQSERMKWANRCIKLGNRKQRITDSREKKREKAVILGSREGLLYMVPFYSHLLMAPLGRWKTTTTLSLFYFLSFSFFFYCINKIWSSGRL